MPGQHDAERMQPAEKRDDDRREAVARGEAEIELPELARRLEDAGEPRHRRREIAASTRRVREAR